MFRNVTLRGPKGAIVWAYRTAATVERWIVRRRRDVEGEPWRWELEGALGPAPDSFSLRQRPLLFTAPRKGGLFCWPVQTLSINASTGRVSATLGPPEY